MSKYIVKPLKTGEMEVNKAALVGVFGEVGIFKVPIPIWYIQGPDAHILVDAGIPTPEKGRLRGKLAKGGGANSIRQALKRAGVLLEEIQTLILTHLHYDHCANLDMFPHAKIVVQRDELLHAVDPTPTQRGIYLQPAIQWLLGRKRPTQLEIVDGDKEIVDGINVVKAVGHTPGIQVVSIETGKGIAIICSDVGPLYRNWYPLDERYGVPIPYLKFIPDGLHIESDKTCLKTMEKIMDIADILLPGHEPEIIGKVKQIPKS